MGVFIFLFAPLEGVWYSLFKYNICLFSIYICLIKINSFSCISTSTCWLEIVLWYVFPRDPSLLWVVPSAFDHARRAIWVVAPRLIIMIWLTLSITTLRRACRKVGFSSLLIPTTGAVGILLGVFSFIGWSVTFVDNFRYIHVLKKFEHGTEGITNKFEAKHHFLLCLDVGNVM